MNAEHTNQSSQTEPVSQQLLALVKSFGHKTGCAKNAFGEHCTCGVDEAIAAAEQAQQAEPVAWEVLNGVVSHDVYCSKADAEEVALDMQKAHDLSGSFAAFNVRPLYAQPPAVAARIRELEAQLNAAILARREAQQVAQEAIEARNGAGAEIRRPLLKRIAELEAQQAAVAVPDATVGKLRLLVAACNRIEEEAEEFEGPDGLGMGIAMDYWHEFAEALTTARKALAAAQKGGA